MVRSIRLLHVKNISSRFLYFPDKGLAWYDSPICADIEKVSPTTSTFSAIATLSTATVSSLLVDLVSLVALFLLFEVIGGRKITIRLYLGILVIFGCCAVLVHSILGNLAPCIIFGSFLILGELNY